MGDGRERGGGERPSSTDPFERLDRSHRRLEEALAALERAAAEGDLDVLHDVSAFFSRQVRRHEADEESSLLPRLLEGRPPEDALAVLCARIEREHREHEALHAALADEIAALDAGEASARDAIMRLATSITAAYRAHIDAEERELFPAARAALDASVLASIATEMDARRGGGGGGRGR